MSASEKQTAKNGIGQGTPGPGRPAGIPNKTTRQLKEAILNAAEQVGEDGSGADGLTGYLRHVAKTDVKAFASLLAKVLPTQLADQLGDPLEVDAIQITIVDPMRH